VTNSKANIMHNMRAESKINILYFSAFFLSQNVRQTRSILKRDSARKLASACGKRLGAFSSDKFGIRGRSRVAGERKSGNRISTMLIG